MDVKEIALETLESNAGFQDKLPRVRAITGTVVHTGGKTAIKKEGKGSLRRNM